MQLSAPDALELGLIDGIIPEPPGGAHLDYDAAASTLREQLLEGLEELRSLSPEQLVAQRWQKFRSMGAPAPS